MSEKSVNGKRIYKSFDALKGLVILITVVVGHYWQFTPGGYYADGANAKLVEITNKITAFSFGKTFTFMELLLMISGFQLYSSYQKIKDGTVEFGSYLGKRVKRLFPVSALAAILMFIGVFVYYQQTGSYWYNTSPAPGHFIENLFMVQSWVNTSHTLNGTMWYVSVYFFCTILYYILARLGGKGKGGIFWMAVPVIAGLWLIDKKLDTVLLNADMARGYIGFFFGVLVAAASAKLKDRQAYIYSLLSIAVFVVFYKVFGGFFKSGTSLDRTLPMMVLLFAPMLILLAHSRVLDRIVGNPVLSGLGKISYCMAAFNFPFYVWMAILDGKFGWNLPYTKVHMYYIIAGAQIVLAIIVYLLYEKPLGKFLSSNKTKPQKAETKAQKPENKEQKPETKEQKPETKEQKPERKEIDAEEMAKKLNKK